MDKHTRQNKTPVVRWPIGRGMVLAALAASVYLPVLSAEQLGDVVVVGKPVEETAQQGSQADEFDAASIIEVISREEIRANGDAVVSQALQRLPAVGLSESRYLTLRGLGQRYSEVHVNGFSVPSPHATRRDVPLDIFASTMVERIRIHNSWSPDLMGNFSAGSAEIETRTLPEQRLLQFRAGLGGNSQTTFKDGFGYEGGGTDWLGYDDGSRALPGLIDSLTQGGRLPILPAYPVYYPQGFSDEQIQAMGRSLSSDYALHDIQPGPDASLFAAWGDRAPLTTLWQNAPGGWQLGFVSLANYRNQWRSRHEQRAEYNVDGQVIQTSEIDRTLNHVDADLYLATGAQGTRGQTDHELALIYQLNRATDDLAIGTLFDNRLRLYWNSALEYEEREIGSTQVSGSHAFHGWHDLKLDWRASVADASRSAPDWRFSTYNLRPGTPEFTLSRESGSETGNERWFSDSNDSSQQLGVDSSLPFSVRNVFAHVKLGLAKLDQTRDLNTLRLAFETSNLTPDEVAVQDINAVFSVDNINPDKLVLQTKGFDRFDAALDTQAAYLRVDLDWLDRLHLMAGVRQEHFDQSASTTDINDLRSTVTKRYDDLLPAVSLTGKLSQAQNLRMAWSQTVNRPDLREINEYIYLDPESGLSYKGNANLVQAEIQNLDLRYEWLTGQTHLAVSLFRKNFDQPIEQVLQRSTGRNFQRTYANADTATLNGVSMEFEQTLASLLHALAGFSVGGNLTLIDSEVKIDPANTLGLTHLSRPMQGQSPWIANIKLGYEPSAQWQMALLYRDFGRRIFDVGADGLNDVYLESVPQLDFNLRHAFNPQHCLRLTLGNLLDAEERFTQRSAGEDLPVRRYTTGINTLASYEWSWQ